MLYYLDLFGVAIFALTGVLVAQKRRVNGVGCIIFAILTALGGGTLRDLLLGNLPVFWIHEPFYLLLASSTGFVSLGLTAYWSMALESLWFWDAVGLAAFTVVGVQVALAAPVSWMMAAPMGVITGVGGGVMRDMFGADVPFLFREKGYAWASLAGALSYVALVMVLGWDALAMGIAIALILTLRCVTKLTALASPPEARSGFLHQRSVTRQSMLRF